MSPAFWLLFLLMTILSAYALPIFDCDLEKGVQVCAYSAKEYVTYQNLCYARQVVMVRTDIAERTPTRKDKRRGIRLFFPPPLLGPTHRLLPRVSLHEGGAKVLLPKEQAKGESLLRFEQIRLPELRNTQHPC